MRNRLLLPLAAVVAAATLTACGGTAAAPPDAAAPGAGGAPTKAKRPDVQQMIDQSVTRAKQAKSAAMKGKIMDDGKPIEIDMEGLVDGSNQRVRVAQDGQRIEMIVADGTTWVSPMDAATAEALGMPPEAVGKFTEMPKDGSGGLGEMNLASLIKELSDPGTMSTLQKANIEVTDVTEQGRAAWRLKERVASDGTELVIAGDGNPDLLRFSSPKDGGMEFSKWNAAATFSAPPKDKIFTP